MSEFREIPNYPEYVINDKGVVRNILGKYIKHVQYTNRPVEVVLSNQYGRQNKSINVLLKATFPEMFEPKVLESYVYHVEGTEPQEIAFTEQQLAVRAVFDYDREEGCLYYKGTNIVARRSYQTSGYAVVNYQGHSRLEHSLIILYMLGESYLQYEIDHVNHKRDDNRWCNLRVVCRKTNSKNLSISKANCSGVTGVSWHTQRNKWRAYIMVNYKQVNLGLFKTKEEAIKARKEAEIRYGFHVNHGDRTTL
jgi:hypothetical protein